MNKKTVIEQIKKCLALSKSANQHEAAAALRQAMAFMQKYKIDANDPELLGIAEVGHVVCFIILYHLYLASRISSDSNRIRPGQLRRCLSRRTLQYLEENYVVSHRIF